MTPLAGGRSQGHVGTAAVSQMAADGTEGWRSGGNGDGRRRPGTELGKLAWAHVCIIVLDELYGLDLSAKFMISDPGSITL